MKKTWANKQKLFPEFNDGCFTRDDMTEEREREWVDFCFDAYESDGFKLTFETPYSGEKKYVGMKFDVLGRVPDIKDDFENGADLECQPMWIIRLENGEEMAAYPEEICLSETPEYMKKNANRKDNKMERIKSALDELGIAEHYWYKEKEYWYGIVEFWTNTAGQDIPMEIEFDGTAEDFVKKFSEAADLYDVDEQVELFVGMRGINGVPRTVVEILADCQEAKDTLIKIKEKLQEAIDILYDVVESV